MPIITAQFIPSTDDSPICRILQEIRSKKINPKSSLIFVSDLLYKKIEDTLQKQMGSSLSTKYGEVPNSDISVAISCEKFFSLHYIYWISCRRHYEYNFEEISNPTQIYFFAFDFEKNIEETVLKLQSGQLAF